MADQAATAQQEAAVSAVMAYINDYLDMRFQQARRVNPTIEQVWPDTVWQQKDILRICISGTKAFGPDRYHVAELLLADDSRKRAELFSPKSQNCLQGEIIEEKESDAQRTRGQMEIHDARSTMRVVAPQFEGIITLIQTYIWWDLPDAARLARFDRKVGLLQRLKAEDYTDDLKKHYMMAMGLETPPKLEQAREFETKALAETINSFRHARVEESGYQAIIAHEKTPGDNADRLIEATGSQIATLRGLQNGSTLDESMTEQFAKAMHCDPQMVTNEKAITFLENTIAANRKRLRLVLEGGGSGEPYNYKRRQLENLRKRFEEVVADDADAFATLGQPRPTRDIVEKV